MKYTPGAWSYSSISTFKQCPHRYYRERVVKDIPKEPDSEAILYGVALHSAAEDFIGKGIPLPEKFAYIQPYLDVLNELPGTKYTEHKMGIAIRDGRMEACEFFAKDVWFRGVADLIVVNEEAGTGRILDYKTGKSSRYADTTQLDLMAAAMFLHFPQVQKIKAALLFVVPKEMVSAPTYEYDKRFIAFEKLNPVLHRRTIAYETGVFNATPNNLCKSWCPVKDCPHNGKR